MERDTATKQIKYEVLREVAENAFNDTLTQETLINIPYKLIPNTTPRYRCCVYKEREIIRQRIRLAMNRPPLPMENAEHIKMRSDKMIHVIPAACEGCPINRFHVTENCQNCMEKSCKKACPFGAIMISPQGAHIDQSKCRECGRCADACPYHAIADLVRPCKRSCDVGAISMNEEKLAVIDDSKCICCGHCAQACPFGAISDMSQILRVIDYIKSDKKTIAIPAPAAEGQFGPQATIGRLATALKILGFDEVHEVALGGDAVAYNEAKELIEHKEAGEKMTTSCCPAFVALIRMHYPELAEKMSKTLSPMGAVVRWLRGRDPDAKIVFIGPCIAKKAEATFEPETAPDAVMTFEELNALLDSRRIDPCECEEDETFATSFGRRFSGTQGVSEAVLKAAKELGCEDELAAKPCSGVAECKIALAMLKAGKLKEDIIEGMACEGGCIAGPGSINTLQQLRMARMKKIKGRDEDNITEMLTNQEFIDTNMTRGKFVDE